MKWRGRRQSTNIEDLRVPPQAIPVASREKDQSRMSKVKGKTTKKTDRLKRK